MSTASIWDPAQTFIPTVNANLSVVPEKFVATPGQAVFNITNFVYTLGTNSLLLFKDGDLLVNGVDYAETSAASFTLTVPCTGGEKIAAIGFVEISATVGVPGDGTVTPAKLSVSFTLPVNKGGTGATNAGDALANLGGMPKAGGTFTGPVVLNDDAGVAKAPTTLQQVQAMILGVSQSAVWDFRARQEYAGKDFFVTY